MTTDYDWPLSLIAQYHHSGNICIFCFILEGSMEIAYAIKSRIHFLIFWMLLHLWRLLLNMSAIKNWSSGGNTILDVIFRILLVHSDCLVWKSPKVSTVSSLEFKIASVYARSILNDLSFNDPPCVFKRDNRMFCADQICLSQVPPMCLDAVGFLCQTM